MVEQGFRVFAPDKAVLRWAKAARRCALGILSDPQMLEANLRHGRTWFVGVDVLPNTQDGAIEAVPLAGVWRNHVQAPAVWHRAQLSVVYPGYPAQDVGESDANHRYRITRYAAHVDGLLPIGPHRRRFLREPHAFILGLPLNDVDASPLMVYPGSHRIMGAAFQGLLTENDPSETDLTDIYQSARRRVFDSIAPVPVAAQPGQVVLLHRHMLHGVAPWTATSTAWPEGRMIAYFRPQFEVRNWVNAP